MLGLIIFERENNVTGLSKVEHFCYNFRGFFYIFYTVLVNKIAYNFIIKNAINDDNLHLLVVPDQRNLNKYGSG